MFRDLFPIQVHVGVVIGPDELAFDPESLLEFLDHGMTVDRLRMKVVRRDAQLLEITGCVGATVICG